MCLFCVCFFSDAVDGGQRAVIFDRFRGVLQTVSGEGTHFLIPWVQKPIIFSIRSRPRRVPVVTGSKGQYLYYVRSSVWNKLLLHPMHQSGSVIIFCLVYPKFILVCDWLLFEEFAEIILCLLILIYRLAERRHYSSYFVSSKGGVAASYLRQHWDWLWWEDSPLHHHRGTQGSRGKSSPVAQCVWTLLLMSCILPCIGPVWRQWAHHTERGRLTKSERTFDRES